MSDTTSINTHPVISNNPRPVNINTESQMNNRNIPVEAINQVIVSKFDETEPMSKESHNPKFSEFNLKGNMHSPNKNSLEIHSSLKDESSLDVPNSINKESVIREGQVIDSNFKNKHNEQFQSDLSTIHIGTRSGNDVPIYPDEINEEKSLGTRMENEFSLSQEDDNASVLVIILQCESKLCDANIINLKWAFSDPYFTIQVCAVDPPPNIPTSKTLTYEQYMENYYMRKALTYAAEGPYIANSKGVSEAQLWWSKIPVIIVKDSSVSNITPSSITDEEHSDNPEDEIIGGMKRRITVALNKASQADLFFLCKWHDACNKYVDVEGVGGIDHSSTLKWSVQPTATQAIMYTPSSRDYIRESLLTATLPISDLLNTNISKGNLLATVFVPNIIDFDIDLATSNDDYNKLNECAHIQTTSQSSNNVASFLWFAVIIILIILVAWALIQLSPQYIVSPSPSS